MRKSLAVLIAGAVLVQASTAAAQLQDPYGPPKTKAPSKKAKPKKKKADEPPPPPPAPDDSLQDPYGPAKKTTPPTPAPTPKAQPKASADDTISVPHKGTAIDNAVAASLLARASVLYNGGDYTNARLLAIESLARSPKGPSAARALELLKQANAKLNKAPYSGAPSVVKPAQTDNPLDPYAGKNKKTDVLDPYAGKSKAPGDDPLDPYAGKAGKDKTHEPQDDVDAARKARVMLIGWSGLLGLSVGLAIGGPEDDNGDVSGGAVLAGILGGGATAALGWLLTRNRKLTAGQSAAIMSAQTWGGYNIGLFADALKTQGTTANEVFTGVAIGGVLGMVAGSAYALKVKPSVNDVSMMNSFGGYGTLAGWMLGVAMDPPEGEAYNVNAMLGSVAGIGVGMYLASEYDVPRSRMLRIDLGAGLGVAAAWALFYPLISDDTTHGDEQAAGLVSVLTGVGGGVAAWYLTRKMGSSKKAEKEGVASPYPSLLRRSSKGAWSTGVPIPRPIYNPALAPRGRGMAMGIDVAAGLF